MAQPPQGFQDKKWSLSAPEPQDGNFKMLGIDAYEDGLVLRWEAPPGKVVPASIESMGFQALTLRDDLGTVYAPVATSGGVAKGWTKYAPAIPSEAAWLEVFTSGTPVRFDLHKPK